MFRSPHLHHLKFRRHIVLIDIFSGDITPYERDGYYSLKSPEYQTNATCPTFDKILDDCFDLSNEKQQLINYFWSYVGYSFLYENNHIQWVLTGTDTTGKHEVISLILHTFSKNLSDVDTILDYEFMSEKQQKNYTQNKCINVIPFYGNNTYKITPVQLDIISKTEREGIAQKALKGLQDIFKNRGFATPNEAQKATDNYVYYQDDIALFIKDNIVEIDNPKLRISDAELYEAYLKWYKNNRNNTWNIKTLVIFNKSMSKQNMVSFRSSKCRLYKGIALIDK